MSDEIRILHVDTDSAFTELAKVYLEREDGRFVVETENNPREVLSKIESDPPDCVVSDYDMPQMNGLELLEAIRSGHPRLPFVLFTGKGTESVASQAISAGVSEYVQKEITTDQYAVLASRINKSIERFERERELEQYRTVVETAGDGVCVLDENAHIAIVNPAFERLSGYDRTALIGTHVSEVLPAEAVEKGTTTVQSLFDAENVASDSFTFTTDRDGRGRQHYETTLSLVRTANSFSGTVCLVRDSTEQRRKQQLLDGLFEGSLDGIGIKEVVTDDEGTPIDYVYKQVNERFEELTGLDAETVVGQRATDVIDGIEETPFIEIFGAVALGEGPVRFEQYSGPLERYYDISAFSPRHGECISIFSDISERKAREYERERSRELLRVTEQLANVGGWEIDVETGTQRWTPGTYAIHGIDPDGDFEPTVDAGIDFYHPEDRETIERALTRCMEAGEPYDEELRLRTADDRQRWIRTSGEAITDGDEVVTVRGAIQDITERKEREQQLQRQNNRLEEFTSIVSHDLRNPLTVAIGRLELAQTECDSEHLDPIGRAHERMAVLIDDLLTLAREGEQLGTLESVGLDALVEQCWANVATGDATVVQELQRPIQADRSRLQQFLENLMRNAIEHGGDDVTVTVGEMPTGFYVEDDGPGIPEANREEVFEAGYSTSTNGTGFGLSIAKQVANAHGWDVRVTEGSAGGARFEITGVAFDTS